VAWGGRELLLRLGGREIWMRATAGALVLACALVAHAQARHWRDDLALFSHALAVTERNVLAHTLVAAALEREGSFAEAIVHYEAALSVSDESRRLGGAPAQRPRLRVHLGQALEREGRFAEAARRYQEHLQDVPDDTHALLQLARIRAAHPDPALRDGASALELARRANRLSGYGNPRVLDVLAAALAETGDFAAAVATAGRAVEIAREAGDARSAQRIASRVSGYQEGRPSRMTVR
jgi:tetratricopeptide (TPR) repeat protein